ncbi:DNA mismatch repair protein MutL [Suillus weaverae]|nr:DNA mismatch repair protein MutL [Suillus weaverae]
MADLVSSLDPTASSPGSIRAIDSHSVHRITSGQVVIDLQTAVKELVENSLDARATNIEVRFLNYGLKSIEVIDNGCGIAPKDYDSVALKHHTSKLAAFEDLSTVLTFGFRGEALSSLCALSDGVTLTTATANEAPMGTILEMDRNGRLRNSNSKVARQRGTTVIVSSLFKPLPVRRKELERNAKREFGKALNLLYAYALVPCATENRGVRLAVSNQPEGGRKTIQLKTDGSPSIKASVTALWGSKGLDNVVDLDLSFDVLTEKTVLRRLDQESASVTTVKVRGLISKFAVGVGRTGSDRQFFFVNGRPCNLGKIQKAFNEVYRSFNVGQSPFIIADFILPTHACDVNVSPDKRTIFLHSEQNLIQALKAALEEAFASSRSTFDVGTQSLQQPTLHPSFTPKTSLTQTKHTRAINRSARMADINPESEPGQPAERDREDGPIMMDALRSLLEPEPELPSHSETDRTATESPSAQPDKIGATPQPLFFPDPDVEENGDNGQATCVADHHGSHQEDESAREQVVSAIDRIRASRELNETRKRSASQAPSAQTVLTTKDASWNRGRSGDGDPQDDGPRKRLRLAEQDGRASFRFTLSQYARAGSKVAETSVDRTEDRLHTDARRSLSEEIDGAEEQDQLMEDEEAVNVTSKNRPRRISGRTGVTEETTILLDNTKDPGPDRLPLAHEDHPALEPDSHTTNPDICDTIDLTEDDVSMTLVDTEVNAPTTHSPKDHLPPVTLRCDLNKIRHTWLYLERAKPAPSELSSTASRVRDELDTANVENAEDNAKASAALSRIISKTDFNKMRVVGQFNLGFIITRWQKYEEGLDDLFVIDQHAADEKYNFETLQQTTVIESQRLFRPKLLELTAADEILAVENIDVLKRNGFEVVRQGGNDDEEGRLHLVTQPVSKDTVFDTKDLEELIHLLRDRPVGTMVRCSKARAMFAMRACRKSVMIGKALSANGMTSIVQHMSTMDQPWNCPHGRPTMRHVSDLTSFARYDPLPRKIDWTAFEPGA